MDAQLGETFIITTAVKSTERDAFDAFDIHGDQMSDIGLSQTQKQTQTALLFLYMSHGTILACCELTRGLQVPRHRGEERLLAFHPRHPPADDRHRTRRRGTTGVLLDLLILELQYMVSLVDIQAALWPDDLVRLDVSVPASVSVFDDERRYLFRDHLFVESEGDWRR